VSADWRICGGERSLFAHKVKSVSSEPCLSRLNVWWRCLPAAVRVEGSIWSKAHHGVEGFADIRELASLPHTGRTSAGLPIAMPQHRSLVCLRAENFMNA